MAKFSPIAPGASFAFASTPPASDETSEASLARPAPPASHASTTTATPTPTAPAVERDPSTAGLSMLERFGRMSEQILTQTEQIVRHAKDARALSGVATMAKTSLALYRASRGLDDSGAGPTAGFDFNFANGAFPPAAGGATEDESRAAEGGDEDEG